MEYAKLISLKLEEVITSKRICDPAMSISYIFRKLLENYSDKKIKTIKTIKIDYSTNNIALIFKNDKIDKWVWSEQDINYKKK